MVSIKLERQEILKGMIGANLVGFQVQKKKKKKKKIFKMYRN
jgi:trehalose-6-phosphate synthase